MKFIAEHIGLAAKDSGVLKDWYVNMLGAKVVFDNGQTPPSYLIALSGGSMLEIYPADSASRETAYNLLAGFRHLALRVESVEQAKAELESKGIKFTDPIKPAAGGGRVLFFRDAEENLVHLVERAPDSTLRV